jgi:hypothetical protein
MAINFDNTNAGVITLKPATSGTITFVLPSADGTANQVLKTDGSGNLSFGGATIGVNAVVTALLETTTISGTAPTATYNYDVNTQSVLLNTANAVNNWTLNVRGAGAVTLNSTMAVGNSITIAHAQTVNSITFYQSAFTIDGVSVTPKWTNATAPTNSAGTGIDMYVYTIIKTAASTYTVFASRTNYT